MPTTLNDIPQPGQSLGLTRDQVRTNFSTISTAFSIDHLAYNETGQGKHNQITFPVHTGSVPFTGSAIASEIYMFNQKALPSNVSDIWLQRGSGAPYPMTSALPATNGYSYLPSGILMKWGLSGNLNTGSNTVTFPVATNIPAFTSIYNVQISPFGTTSNQFRPMISTIGTATLSIYNPGPAMITVFYFAIGN